MNFHKQLLALSLLLLLGIGSATAQWQKKQAPIMTPWGEALQETDPIFNEYPRPQKKRAEWINLNGVWDMVKVTGAEASVHLSNSNWKYTTGGSGYSVGSGWESNTDFDDSSWRTGQAPFGTISGSRTQWSNQTIYLRMKAKFSSLKQEDLDKLCLSVFHDEDFQLYINGVLAWSSTGYTVNYEIRDIRPEAKAAIKIGEENLFAIKCTQTTGGQMIDVKFIFDQVTQVGSYRAHPVRGVPIHKIMVPFPVESALSGVMDTDYTNKRKQYSYKRTFTIPESMKGKNILLHFGAVDWSTGVFINEQKVGTHKGGFDPFYFDITPYLKESGEQELQVQVYDPTRGGQPKGKQVNDPEGIWYTPSSGIWQTVWLEPVADVHIEDFLIVPDVDNSLVKIKVEAKNATAGTRVEIAVLDGESTVATQTVTVGEEASIRVADAKLWSPESPFLYNLKFTLKDGGTVVDNVDSYFGMRKISLGTLRGKPFMYLNNKPYFHYGPLDQGFWPDGLLSAPSYEALRFDLEKTKELGFNMTRKHIKIEPARWYYYCDSIGLMVWQDMVCPEGGDLGHSQQEWVRENFYRESENVVKSLINHPSIVVWVPYNEGWGQYAGSPEHTRNGVDLIRRLDPTRLINAASGWTNYELGDISDRHNYTTPAIHPNPFNLRANVCGETGGYSLEIDGHVWRQGTTIYNKVENSSVLTERLEELNDVAYSLSAEGFAAVVYTQITDVEAEQNGFWTYDRKVSKLDDEQKVRFKAGIDRMNQLAIQPTALKNANYSDNLWKYRMASTAPATGWNTNMDFNDASWSEGLAGFGSTDINTGVVNTVWNTSRIYLRKKYKFDNMTREQIDALKLQIFYDEDVQVWINGIQVVNQPGYVSNYRIFEISQEAKNSIIPGQDNLITVECRHRTGGRFIDLGFAYVVDFDAEDTSAPEKVFTSISTAEELYAIRDNLSGFYELTADIDLSGYANWEPIGSLTNPFTGYLKGNNHTIKNLNIERLNDQLIGGNYQGLIAYANGAYITDLEILDAQVIGQDNVGALLGKALGTTVERVVITNPIVEGVINVGAISGGTDGITASFFNDCYVVDGIVFAYEAYGGGLLGTAQFTKIRNSYFTGYVESIVSEYELSNVGGIIGGTEMTPIEFAGSSTVILEGVASLATAVIGYFCNQFVSLGPMLLSTKNTYTWSEMIIPGQAWTQWTFATPEQTKDLSEFKTQSLYESMGWDFTNIWTMSHDGFPVFKYKGTSDINIPNTKQNKLNVYSSDKNIIIHVDEATAVWIYDISGHLVKRVNIDSETTVPLPAGVYLLKAVAGNSISSAKVINK